LPYTVAVRTLCEFAAREGDLDLRFTPAPSAQEGIAGHQLVAARRGAGYQAELALSGTHGLLTVRGRADGYDAARNRLEEIKTHRGDAAAIPENHRALHRAQLRVYGHLLCSTRALDGVELALVYVELGTQAETVLCTHERADALRLHFEALCGRFLDWAARELAHREARDRALAGLAFPHPAFREGQRELAEAVYRANRRSRRLLVQAPTGIGKTVGTLFPLLKALPGEALDKAFYLSAKGSGRALALDALARLVGGGSHAARAPVRVLELVARDTACVHPDKACHGESCPLARGFYDRLPRAREAAIAAGFLDQAAVRTAALAHAVCPYYLSQDLVRWCDVVVGDYNYYFDASALLHGLALANDWRASLLVDEAHNLVERARTMYSADLDQRTLAALRATAPAALRPALDRLHRAWNGVHRGQAQPFAVLPEPPARWLAALQQACTAITDHLAQAGAASDAALLAFYFDALHLCRLAERFGPHSQFDVTLDSPVAGAGRRARRSTLCLRNLLPAPFLAPRFAAAHAVALFSATLSPWTYHRDTLGLPADTVALDVASPFRAEQLAVSLVAGISTRYRDREASVAPIVELVVAQYRRRPGNYLVFASSFEYLGQIERRLAQRAPEIPSWTQSRGMAEAERAAFLERFVPGGCGLGFAVLGGLFGEGIDLPGERLVGAFIATLGLPPVNPVNEALRERLQQAFGSGYAYAYLYPGVQRVVQAAGRVIRTPQDRGVLYLIDDRFGRAEVRELLPAWWRPRIVAPLRLDEGVAPALA
jgi:Rad3-related DNA helicase